MFSSSFRFYHVWPSLCDARFPTISTLHKSSVYMYSLALLVVNLSINICTEYCSLSRTCALFSSNPTVNKNLSPSVALKLACVQLDVTNS